MTNYTPYHVHTWYSLLDSATSPEMYIKKAAELGMKSFGFSEHGNLFNWYEKLNLCKKHGIKYLHGVECYITSTHVPKIKDNMHTILIAKNMEGFKELNRLMFLANQPDHTYYKHRLSIEEFLNISDNIIKISACIQSPLWKLRNDSEIMDALLKKYDYYEVQYHKFEDNIEFTKMLCDYAKKYNKPLIVGTDTHSLNQYKAECRTMLQYGKTESDWGDSENACDLTFKTYDQLVELFLDQGVMPKETILEALENTNVMADSCEEIVIDTHDKYPYLYGDKDEEVLWDVLHKNYEDKLKRGVIPENPQYLANIDEEMAVFKKVNMVGFMLFMSEMMTWAKEQHIATGFSRGSVSGSTVAFISNITDVDPVRWNTIFSRFCNEHRVEAGDIDTDWYEDDRPKIYDYIINRFGAEKTGYILAFGTLSSKSTIDTIGRGIRKMKPDCNYQLEDMSGIKALFEQNPLEARNKYPDLFYYYDGLLDTPVSQGQHPAGIVASPLNLAEFCSKIIGTDGQEIIALDMNESHHVGLIKYDILGLKTVGVIDKTCKMIGKNFPKVEEINFEDKDVFNDMVENQLTIFQFESSYAGDCFKKMHCQSIDDITLVNAAMRPGGASYREKLFSHEVNDNGSVLINDILKESYGYLAYQEEVTAFLQYVCGFSGSDADSIRRAIGKKDAEKIAAAMPKILEGYCAKSDKPHEVAEQEAKKFLKIIEDASEYMFNKNHALGYSLLTYLCGYYRHYYPVEYCTAYISCAKNQDDFNNGRALANMLGITISDIKFRHTAWDYRCDAPQKTIYKGLFGVKYMNKASADFLFKMRSVMFEDFVELIQKAKANKINIRQLTILTKLNFFEEFGSIKYLLKILEIYEGFKTRKKCFELTREAIKDIKPEPASDIEAADYEFDATGTISRLYPNMDKSCYYIIDKQGRMGTLYQMQTGKIFKIKFKKQNLFDKGMLIKIMAVGDDGRWTKNDAGKWVQSKTDFEKVISMFSMLNTGSRDED